MEYSIAEYRKAYVEVLAVLATFKPESRARIPQDRWDHMEAEKDPEYEFELNPKVLFKYQLSALSCGLLAYIYYNYICTDAEREAMDIERAVRKLP